MLRSNFVSSILFSNDGSSDLDNGTDKLAINVGDRTMKNFIVGFICGALIVAMSCMWIMATLEREIDNQVAYYNIKNNTYINHFRDSVEEASRYVYGNKITELFLKWYSFCDVFYHWVIK